MANGASFERIDRYTLIVNGFRIRADETAEAVLRKMTQEELMRFLFILGHGG